MRSWSFDFRKDGDLYELDGNKEWWNALWISMENASGFPMFAVIPVPVQAFPINHGPTAGDLLATAAQVIKASWEEPKWVHFLRELNEWTTRNTINKIRGTVESMYNECSQGISRTFSIGNVRSQFLASLHWLGSRRQLSIALSVWNRWKANFMDQDPESVEFNMSRS